MDQHSPSAFKQVEEQHQITTYYGAMEDYAKRLLLQSEKIRIIEYLGGIEIPFFLKLFINIILHLLIKVSSNKSPNQNEQKQSFFQRHIKNPLSLKIKASLFKLIASIIQKRLFVYEQQKYSEQIGFSMIFNQSLVLFLILLISENTNIIRLDRFFDLYRSLIGSDYRDIVSRKLYYIYGGQTLKIAKEKFEDSLNKLIAELGSYITNQNSLFSRNIDYIKQSKERMNLVNQAIVLLADFNNQKSLRRNIALVSQNIFENQTLLYQQAFYEKIKYSKRSKNIKEDPIKQYIWVFFELLRCEMIMLESKKFIFQVQSRKQVINCSYYLDQMKKIMKKCPFNGHESCFCSKCKCVRRNRESAKLSQEKKRNALEQVTVLRERIDQLQRKNQQLFECNMFLRGLFESMGCDPNIRNMLSITLEPISKIVKQQEQY